MSDGRSTAPDDPTRLDGGAGAGTDTTAGTDREADQDAAAAGTAPETGTAPAPRTATGDEYGSAPERAQKRRSQTWEIRAQVGIETLRAMANESENRCHHAPGGPLCPECDSWRRHLVAAEEYLDARPSIRNWREGTRIEGTWGHIEAATVDLVRTVFDDEQIIGLTPRIRSTIDRCLRPLRPERLAADAILERLAKEPPGPDAKQRGEAKAKPDRVTKLDRETLCVALQAANDSNGANYQRLRRFQDKVMGSALIMVLLVLFVLYVGAEHPRLFPLCFPDPEEQVDEAPVTGTEAAPPPVVCPSTATPNVGSEGAKLDADERASGADVATVLLFGLIGASLTSVAFVIRPTAATGLPATSIRVFQGILKAATGMITAVLGLLFLRAGVVPGFTRIDTRSQILVYAVVFGAAQHLVTRLIDARSDTLLDSVKTNASPVISGDETGPDDAAS